METVRVGYVEKEENEEKSSCDFCGEILPYWKLNYTISHGKAFFLCQYCKVGAEYHEQNCDCK